MAENRDGLLGILINNNNNVNNITLDLTDSSSDGSTRAPSILPKVTINDTLVTETHADIIESDHQHRQRYSSIRYDLPIAKPAKVNNSCTKSLKSIVRNKVSSLSMKNKYMNISSPIQVTLTTLSTSPLIINNNTDFGEYEEFYPNIADESLTVDDKTIVNFQEQIRIELHNSLLRNLKYKMEKFFIENSSNDYTKFTNEMLKEKFFEIYKRILDTSLHSLKLRLMVLQSKHQVLSRKYSCESMLIDKKSD